MVGKTLPIFVCSRVLVLSLLGAPFKTYHFAFKPRIMANTAISEGTMMLLLTFQRKKQMKNGKRQKTFLIITGSFGVQNKRTNYQIFLDFAVAIWSHHLILTFMKRYL